MSEDLYKFGWLPDGTHEVRFEYPNVWATEKTTGPDRLVIAPRNGYVRLLLDLAKRLEPPYGVLYVLTVPRGGGKAARYQRPAELSFEELELFFWRYHELFEQDARNSVWIQADTGLLVYDRHNVIYAYGPLQSFKEALALAGLKEASQVRYPSPHTHRYNLQFDEAQARILKGADWIISPLRTGDDV